MPVASHDGVALRWSSRGPTRADAPGEPVLLIMGLAGSSLMWGRLLAHLKPHYWTILFDNRGTGDSDPVRGPLTMADMVADALAVLDAAEVRSAHVIGVSMGGMVAQHMALDHRERVRSLTLGCTAAVGRAGLPPWRVIGIALARPVVGSGYGVALLAPLLYSPQTLEEAPDRVEEDLELRTAEAAPAKTAWAQMAAIGGHDTRNRLAELAGLPTLVLHGADDQLVSPERGAALARAIPGARYVVFENCGHMLATDAEDEMASAILEFLEAGRGASRAA